MSISESIEIAYGRNSLHISLPEGALPTVIRKATLPKLPDESLAVRQALENPIAAKPLSQLAQGRNSACILICDITRPVPNHLFLRPIIETLLGAGMAADQICILVATGLHRPNLGAELEELIGDPWVLKTVRVENHYARNDDDHADLGVTSKRGTPIKIDKRFVDADLRIVTGLIEPHFMAGWSGGRKMVAPGVAHQETIRTFHSARFMEDPFATQCNLVNNPLHEDQLEIVERIGEAYAVNTVQNEDRSLVYINFGEIVASHLAAVDFVTSAAMVNVNRKFSTVVTSAAGYPLDKTYYQTVKAMVIPTDILAPGGTLIVASECSEGMGSEEFRASQARLVSMGPGTFLASIQAKRLADIDEWQSEMQLKPMSIGSVQLYTTGLNEAELTLTGVGRVESLTDAIRASIERSGDNAVAIIPEGPYVVPRCG